MFQGSDAVQSCSPAEDCSSHASSCILEIGPKKKRRILSNSCTSPVGPWMLEPAGGPMHELNRGMPESIKQHMQSRMDFDILGGTPCTQRSCRRWSWRKSSPDKAVPLSLAPADGKRNAPLAKPQRNSTMLHPDSRHHSYAALQMSVEHQGQKEHVESGIPSRIVGMHRKG